MGLKNPLCFDNSVLCIFQAEDAYFQLIEIYFFIYKCIEYGKIQGSSEFCTILWFRFMDLPGVLK